jgi:lipoic acid synthetase
VLRYVETELFDGYSAEAEAMGFTHAASGPRSSYHADQQAHDAGIS